MFSTTFSYPWLVLATLAATCVCACQSPAEPPKQPATAQHDLGDPHTAPPTPTAEAASINQQLYEAAKAKADAYWERKNFRRAADHYALALDYLPQDTYAHAQMTQCEHELTKIVAVPQPPAPVAPSAGIPMPTMLTISGGSFGMGSEKGTKESDPDEYPVHTVFVKSFSLAKTEVTVAQYRAFCNATGRMMPPSPAWGWKEDNPIVNVSWDDANEYCKWLSSKTGKPYRLPTEEEWEFAARGGTASRNSVYAGGADAAAVGWYSGNAGDGTRSVGAKQPNELQLHDMSGNVWEWCSNWYAAYPGGTISKEGNVYRCCRGGSWNYGTSVMRCADRGGTNPAYKYDYLGFRVARD